MSDTKSILITGCSSGIGRCLAEGLQARGYRVFASARKAQDVTSLTQQGFECLLLDVADSASINTAVLDLLNRTNGRLYGLINNAGYGQPGAVEDLRREVLRAQFETNLFGLLELTNLILPTMRAQGYGRIINISSVLGLMALPYRGAYNAAKFALEGLTDTLRLELQDSDVRVSLIEPGPIESNFRANALQAFRNNIDAQNSVHRDRYQAMEKRLSKQGHAVPFTLAPQAVLKKAIHALENPRPKIRYYVTFPTHLIATLKRLLPQRGLDWVARRISRAG